MKKRTTDELLKIIAAENRLENYLTENRNEFDYTTLSEALNDLLVKSGFSKAEVIRQANLDAVYTYQIFNGLKPNPSRNKLLALCLSLNASLTETQYILRLGHSEILHPRNVRDSVVIFALNHNTPVMEVNEILHDMGEDLIG